MEADGMYERYGILEGYEEIRHAVTRRKRGIPFDFSLALHTGEDPETILDNRRLLAGIFGTNAGYVSVRQVHGDGIHIVESSENLGWTQEEKQIHADALITEIPGVVLTILTADCVPVLLFDPVRRAAGAVHAGWRGTAQSILPKTVRKMAETYGSRPENLIAAIGPAIGGCCYEVGTEVAEQFESFPEALESAGNGTYRLDLKEINRRQLLAAGMRPERIEISPVCTSCENDRFFSYRKEGGCSGRFMSCIMLTGKQTAIPHEYRCRH